MMVTFFPPKTLFWQLVAALAFTNVQRPWRVLQEPGI